MKKQNAHTLVEALLVVIFMGILTAMVLPKINFAIVRKQKAGTFSGKMVTDLRRIRRLAITDAANNGVGYQINMIGVSPFTGYEIVNLDPPETVLETHVIESDILCSGGTTFKFGPLGNLLIGDGTQLDISAEGKSFTVTIVTSTGMVKCVEN
jgi:hypothetical protein